jgi:hypothetical protein
MVLLMIAALVCSIAFGSLGWWADNYSADNYSVVPLVTAVFGATFGAALAAMWLHIGQINKSSAQANSSAPDQHARQPDEHSGPGSRPSRAWR